MHDYSEDKPELVNIGHDHFVYGNKKEIEEYKALREKNVPIQAVTIDPVAAKTEKAVNTETEDVENDNVGSEDDILQRPIHDTGNFWLGIGSFLLPIIGLIAGFIFRKVNYIRNYKKCLKGAGIGLIVRAVIIALFFIFLLLSLI